MHKTQNRKIFGKTITGLIFMLFFANLIQAENEVKSKASKSIGFSSTAPISIQADRLKITNRGSKATYRGNVRVEQADMLITGDVIEVVRKNDKIESLLASGKPVRIRSTNVNNLVAATATTLVYKVLSGWLELSGGESEITHFSTKIKGKKIRYNIETEDIEAEGHNNKPALLIIDPESAE